MNEINSAPYPRLEEICQIFTKKTGAIVLPHTKIWIELDIDSISTLEILEEIEQAFNIRLFEDGIDMNALSSPIKIAAYLEQATKTKDTKNNG